MERGSHKTEAPEENFSRGLRQVDIPGLGHRFSGKVRDSWIIDEGDQQYRVMVTTDRQSAYDRIICTVPGKGQVLNLLSAYWFEQTKDIVANHMIAVPHPNVLVAREAHVTLPVEVILRRYMAKSSTTTSVYSNYTNRGRRTIYGIDFPEGLKPNQEFPMGTVLTPTTKAESGHDQELTDEQALEIVDSKLGDGIWIKTKTVAHAIFELARARSLNRGLILVDTKYEFGVDQECNLMLIDELHTPDSSRFWLAETYEEKFRMSATPDTFDKEILRRWLAEKGFKGDGPIPQVDVEIIYAMEEAYTVPFRMITDQELPSVPSDPNLIAETTSQYVASFLRNKS